MCKKRNVTGAKPEGRVHFEAGSKDASDVVARSSEIAESENGQAGYKDTPLPEKIQDNPGSPSKCDKPFVNPLAESLRSKETELQKFFESSADLVATKGKEMSLLLAEVDQVEEEKHKMEKKLVEINALMSKLQLSKDQVLEEKEEQQAKLDKLMHRKEKLENFLDEAATEIEETKKGLEKEITEIKVQLGETGSPKSEAQPESLELLSEYNSLIESREKELECPVCLEVASPPLFCCEDQHLICSQCRPEGVRLFARRTFTTPKFGHFPPPKKNICQEDNCHPQFFSSFFGALFLAFST